MTVENIERADAFLSQAAKVRRELDALLSEAEYMQNLAEKCDNANAKSAAATVRRYGAKINAKVKEYLNLRDKVQTVINAVADDDCRGLLLRRYINNERWEHIAEDMNFSVAHIYRLRKKALLSVQP